MKKKKEKITKQKKIRDECHDNVYRDPTERTFLYFILFFFFFTRNYLPILDILCMYAPITIINDKKNLIG